MHECKSQERAWRASRGQDAVHGAWVVRRRVAYGRQYVASRDVGRERAPYRSVTESVSVHCARPAWRARSSSADERIATAMPNRSRRIDGGGRRYVDPRPWCTMSKRISTSSTTPCGRAPKNSIVFQAFHLCCSSDNRGQRRASGAPHLHDESALEVTHRNEG